MSLVCVCVGGVGCASLVLSVKVWWGGLVDQVWRMKWDRCVGSKWDRFWLCEFGCGFGCEILVVGFRL